MTAPRPLQMAHMKRQMKNLLETRSATSLLDDYVAGVYDCKTLTADDFIGLRTKIAKDSRSKVMLVHIKR